MPPANRIVAFLTPYFTVGAVWLSTWLTKQGIPHPATATLVGAETAGAFAVLAPALKFLHGSQKWEAIEADTKRFELEMTSRVPDAIEKAAQPPAATTGA